MTQITTDDRLEQADIITEGRANLGLHSWTESAPRRRRLVPFNELLSDAKNHLGKRAFTVASALRETHAMGFATKH
jgi:hypothetical protein